jgi:RsiW-degrading membrane proteinase PrsW (M82 family)
MAGISLQTWFFAILGGVVPTFLWLWFWMTESNNDEPHVILVLGYIGGMLGVLILLPLNSYVAHLGLPTNQITILYAILEELIKVSLIAVLAFGSHIYDATDYTIYLVTGALGFSALENTLYLLQPIAHITDIGSVVITGNLRFFGATVLHTVTVAIVGIFIGIAYPLGSFGKTIAAILGIAAGSLIHIMFNTYIELGTRQGTIIAIAGIWSIALVIIMIFDRLKTYQAQVSKNTVTS